MIARLWASVRAFGGMIRLSHTIFGLPFTLASAALAHRWAVQHGEDGLTGWRLLWIVVAFTAARATAMGFNRVVDRDVDAENPRTKDRELPRGAISVPMAWALTLSSAAIFMACAIALGSWPIRLAPACLVVICGYSFFKRWSWSSHLVLGVALALAPGGAWVAITGGFGGWPIPTLLMLTVGTWVAGFDVLYSLADIDFDRRRGLHSIPARFGVRGALWISASLHLATFAALVWLHDLAQLGWLHASGIAAIAIILAYEHWIVRPGDLTRIDRAFFDLNGYISLAYLAATLLDVLT